VWLVAVGWFSGFGIAAGAAIQGNLVSKDEKWSQLSAAFHAAACSEPRSANDTRSFLEAEADCMHSVLSWLPQPITYDDAAAATWKLVYLGLGVPSATLVIGLGLFWAIAAFEEKSVR
jgi:hypothetical protein